MINHLNIIAHDHHVTTVLFSKDGKYLLSAGMDACIKLWDTRNWQQVGKLTGHQKSVNCLILSADSKMLISGSNDNTINI